MTAAFTGCSPRLARIRPVPVPQQVADVHGPRPRGSRAQGWDALDSGNPRARRRMAAWSGFLLVLTLAALAVSTILRGTFLGWLDAQKLASLFGPFDAPGALVELQRGLVQAAVVLSDGPGVDPRAGQPSPGDGRRSGPGGHVGRPRAGQRPRGGDCPAVGHRSTPEALSSIERAEREQPSPGPYRVHRVPIWSPVRWSETASPDRVRDFVGWANETLEPKYGINLGVEYTLTMGVAELYDYDVVLRRILLRGPRPSGPCSSVVSRGTELVVYPRRVVRSCGTPATSSSPIPRHGTMSYRGIASFIDRTERIDPPPDAFLTGPRARHRRTPGPCDHDYPDPPQSDAYPRAWVVHDARAVAPAQAEPDRDRSMEEILFSNDLAWPDPTRIVFDPRRIVWLEDSVLPGLAAYVSGGPPRREMTCA